MCARLDILKKLKTPVIRQGEIKMANESDVTVYSYRLSNGGYVHGCNQTDAVNVCKLLGGWDTDARVLHGYQIGSDSPEARALQRRLQKIRENFPTEFNALSKPSRDFTDILLGI